MKVKCEDCECIVDLTEIEGIGDTGNKDVTEIWYDGSVMKADFIGQSQMLR